MEGNVARGPINNPREPPTKKRKLSVFQAIRAEEYDSEPDAIDIDAPQAPAAGGDINNDDDDPKLDFVSMKEFPSFVAHVAKAVKSFDNLLGSIAKAQDAVKKLDKAIQDQEPPKSLFPNVQLHLPKGYEDSEHTFADLNKRFALEALNIVHSKRKAQLADLKAQANEPEKLLHNALDSFAALSHDHEEITRLISMGEIESYWHIQTLRLKSQHEDVARKKREAEQARLEREAAARNIVNEAPSMELIGKVVDDALNKRLNNKKQQTNNTASPKKGNVGSTVKKANRNGPNSKKPAGVNNNNKKKVKNNNATNNQKVKGKQDKGKGRKPARAAPDRG
jgi:hypothetical protein